jgi:hypothetical protein
VDRINEILKGNRLVHLFQMEPAMAGEGHASLRVEVKKKFLKVSRLRCDVIVRTTNSN